MNVEWHLCRNKGSNFGINEGLVFFSGGPEISSQHEVRKEAQQEEFEVNNIVKI